MDDNGTNITKRKNAPSSGGALVVVPKNTEDLVEEEIDSQILSIIGLEDVFDFTYEEYATLLKEAAVRGRMSSSQMTTEAVELVTNELKRVRGKTGRFKVKRGKINIGKVMNRRAPSPQRILPQNLAPPDEEEENQKVKKFLMGNLPDRLSLVANSLDDINKTLQQQLGIEKKVSEEERKSESKSKKAQREREIEKRDKKRSDEGIKKLKGPVTGFFDAIKRYFGNILAGSIVVGLVNWFQNPANKGAIDKFSNFITNNAPVILGGILALALLPVASTLLGLTTGILGGIPLLIGALKFLASPSGLFALATYLTREGLYKFVLPPLAKGMDRIIESGYKRDYGEGNAAKGKFTTKLRDQYGRIAPRKEFEKMTDEEKTTASFLKMYDDTLKERQKVNNELYQLSAVRSDVRSKPKIEKKEKELKELDEKLQQMESQIRIGGKSFSEMQKQYEEKGESGLPQTSLSKRLYPSQTLKPQTPAVSDYVSPFAGARDREILKASKITGNAPITVGERAGYSASRGRVHRGRDIAAPSGTGLTVPSESVITDKGTEGTYGNYVVFKDANGVEHFYGHMIEPSPLSIGDSVSPGDIVGRVGSTGRSTGPHLHWEVSRVMGEVGRPRANVIDPIEVGFSAQTPFTGKVEAAQLAKTSPSIPTIPSPTGRSGIGGFVPVPIGGQRQVTSASSASQPTIPAFSPEDPNNTNIMTIKAIYNLVG